MPAVKGKGAKFSMGAPLVRLPDVVSLTPPSPTRDTIDTTTHDSSGDYREFISSLIDAGEATILIHYDPGSEGDDVLNDLMGSGEIVPFAIDLNSSAGAQRRTAGSAMLTSYAPADVVIDDKMTATLTLKVSGPLVFGPVT